MTVPYTKFTCRPSRPQCRKARLGLLWVLITNIRANNLRHNQYLLNDILKRDWGFDGVVVSDWGGTHNTDQAIHNGLDLEYGSWTDGMKSGVKTLTTFTILQTHISKRSAKEKLALRNLMTKFAECLGLFSEQLWHLQDLSALLLPKNTLWRQEKFLKKVSFF